MNSLSLVLLQMVKIVRDYGLVVLSRGGTKPFELVYKSDTLNQHKVFMPF